MLVVHWCNEILVLGIFGNTATDAPFLGIYLRFYLLPTMATVRQHGNKTTREGWGMTRGTRARDVLESAREAAADERMVRRQLEAMADSRAPQHVHELHERVMCARLDMDAEAIDRALSLLERARGKVPSWQVEAIAAHYLNGEGWNEIADRLHYNMFYANRAVGRALTTMDGMLAADSPTTP